MNIKSCILFLFAACICLIRAQNTTTCADPLTVATYNTLQIWFAPYQDRRLDATINYFQNNLQNLEILCLQELWDANQRNEVANSLSSLYPHQFAAPGLASTCTGGCSSDEISRIRDCLDTFNCLDAIVTDEDFTDCVTNNCRAVLETSGAKCVTCLQQEGSFSSIFSNLDECLDDNDNSNTNDNCFAFGGESDNLLLSKIPFLETQVLSFTDSPITYTTALYARLNTAQFGNTHVICTHLLPADLPIFQTEQQTNLNQTQELLAFVNSKLNGTEETVILLGDFNHGPGFWDSNYDALVSAGYASTYISLGNNNCTFCESNPLTYGSDTMIIDHVYIRNAQSTASNRILTYNDVNIERPTNPFNDNRIPLSDHYGVYADLCPGNTPALVLSNAVTVVDTDEFGDDEQSPNTASFIGVSFLMTLTAFLF